MAEVTFKLRTGYRYPVVILLGDWSWWSWSVVGWVRGSRHPRGSIDR